MTKYQSDKRIKPPNFKGTMKVSSSKNGLVSKNNKLNFYSVRFLEENDYEYNLD